MLMKFAFSFPHAKIHELFGISPHAAVAQLVERIHGKDEVSGSIPDRGSMKNLNKKTKL